MNYSDSHVHTFYSSDSEERPEAQIERAIALGMKQLTFTEHHDIDFPPGEFDFLLDPRAYTTRAEELRIQYRHILDLGIGIELGLQPHLMEETNAFAALYPWDLIIGSTHVTRRIDPWEEDKLIAGVTEEFAYRTYFEEELENLQKYDCYDIAGHLDYVVRYGPNRNRDYTWERYGDILDEMLKTVLSKGKGIEINTAGFKAGLGYAHPMPEVWKRYRELGGEILTIGSDAHSADYLGYEFERAGEFLKFCGFRYYAVYRERRPEFYPL